MPASRGNKGTDAMLGGGFTASIVSKFVGILQQQKFMSGTSHWPWVCFWNPEILVSRNSLAGLPKFQENAVPACLFWSVRAQYSGTQMASLRNSSKVIPLDWGFKIFHPGR
jgi:hypothetical protein